MDIQNHGILYGKGKRKEVRRPPDLQISSFWMAHKFVTEHISTGQDSKSSGLAGGAI